jgi:hypothetical protein
MLFRACCRQTAIVDHLKPTSGVCECVSGRYMLLYFITDIIIILTHAYRGFVNANRKSAPSLLSLRVTIKVRKIMLFKCVGSISSKTDYF